MYAIKFVRERYWQTRIFARSEPRPVHFRAHLLAKSRKIASLSAASLVRLLFTQHAARSMRPLGNVLFRLPLFARAIIIIAFVGRRLVAFHLERDVYLIESAAPCSRIAAAPRRTALATANSDALVKARAFWLRNESKR